jgi:DUF971 family protein
MCIELRMELPVAIKCHLLEEGLYLTFSDGKTFFYPQSLLFSVRFPYAKVMNEMRDQRCAPGQEGPSFKMSSEST